MTSGGYPGEFEVGKKIEGLEEAVKKPNVTVFHAGSEKEGDEYYTCSGRVLGVTATGDDLQAAVASAYDAARTIRFDGAHFRTDIAASALRSKSTGAG